MGSDITTSRYLGAAVLFVFLASLVSERMLSTSVGSSTISNMLLNASKNNSKIRLSNLLALFNSIGIIVLAGLLFNIFRDQFSALAVIALGLWLAEAVILAISKLGANAFITLSKNFVAAGTPDSSHFQDLGDFLYHGIDRFGYELHMLFFCLDGILWTYMFYNSGLLNPYLSLWGLISL